MPLALIALAIFSAAAGASQVSECVALIAHPHHRVLSAEDFAVGAFNANDFKAHWDTARTFRGGALYSDTLVRLSEEIAQTHGDELGDLFLLSSANRLAKPLDLATQIFSPLPSLQDLYLARRQGPFDLESMHRTNEALVTDGIAKLHTPLSGKVSPLDYTRARMANQHARLRIRVNRTEDKDAAGRFVLLNLKGFGEHALPYRTHFCVLVYDGEEELVGGALRLDGF